MMMSAFVKVYSKLPMYVCKLWLSKYMHTLIEESKLTKDSLRRSTKRIRIKPTKKGLL